MSFKADTHSHFKFRISLFAFLFNTIAGLLLNQITTLAQSQDSSLNLPNRKRLTLVVVGTGVGYAGTMTALSQVWYSQYPHQSFRWFNDASEWKQMDKFGHFYSAFHLSAVGSRLLQWGHLPEEKSDKIAAVASLLMMSSVEIFDGFSAGYGASATDLAANFCGSAFYLGQSLTWREIRIQPKFSFHQSALASVSPNTLGSRFSEELLKNYNGQTYWLSVDMDKFMPFPKWLNLCVGYGAGNMIHAQDSQNEAAGYAPYRKYYFGLDFDLTAIKTKSKALKTLIFVVNRIRLPAPALEFAQNKLKGHYLYF